MPSSAAAPSMASAALSEGLLPPSAASVQDDPPAPPAKGRVTRALAWAAFVGSLSSGQYGWNSACAA